MREAKKRSDEELSRDELEDLLERKTMPRSTSNLAAPVNAVDAANILHRSVPNAERKVDSTRKN
jgi:hypothetical protein